VGFQGRVIAVIARHAVARTVGGGALEQAYLRTAEELINMVVEGRFPLPASLAHTDAPPRVGDGLIRLDATGTVVIASPNALSAFHRLGLAADLLGANLTATATRLSRTPGLVDEAIALVAGGSVAGSAQVENDAATVTLRSIPLWSAQQYLGALVLVRDVTDLRRQEKALLTKDSTIREIHHRVKNNLQTVAALLRLQMRRIDEPAGREALAEAVRRVGAIAVVHETLSMQQTQEADFDEVADRIVALTSDLAPSVPVERVGSAGLLSPDVVTPLAMVIAELLANAVAHGTVTRDGDPDDQPGPAAAPGQNSGHEPLMHHTSDLYRPDSAGAHNAVRLVLARNADRLIVEVIDHGRGLPPGFDPARSTGLGLKIVKTLVNEELGGAVAWEPRVPGGTRVVIDVLLPPMR
jgi:two-component sensor histidine kinase